MRKAYLDCSSGISGDMFLGALLDAGLETERLLAELKKVPLDVYEFKVSRAMRRGLACARVEVIVPAKQPARKLRDIEELLTSSTLATMTKERARKAFTRLAEAEGKLHNRPPDEVHFHEVGAVDAIVDIVGTCAGLELLDISELICSPLNVGAGRVEAAHGSLPVPAPATAELLKNIPVYSTGIEAELVTPTGAVLVTTLASSFGPMPSMRAQQIGYGGGHRDLPQQPNVARLFLGEGVEAEVKQGTASSNDAVSVIEANLDDMNPQLYGYLVDRALAAGALDVTCSAVQMKKNRPGLTITLLTKPDRADELAELLFEQTTTLGLRIYEARRQVLERERVSVETPYGLVRIKVGKRCGKVLNIAPEYDDCRRLAEEKSVPLKQVMLAAQLAYAQWKKGGK